MNELDNADLQLHFAEYARRSAEAAEAAAKSAAAAAFASPGTMKFWVEFMLTTLPLALAAYLLLYILAMKHRAIFLAFGQRMTSFKAMGFEISLDATKNLTNAQRYDFRGQDLRKTHTGRHASQLRVTAEDRRRAIERAAAAAPLLRGRRVLWVDDCPMNNLYEQIALGEFGLIVLTATDNDTAIDFLRNEKVSFDLVISDIARPKQAEDGEALIGRMRGAGAHQPIVFYVSHLDPAKPTPLGAFGITNRPDELVHLAIDALARKGVDFHSREPSPDGAPEDGTEPAAAATATGMTA